LAYIVAIHVDEWSWINIFISQAIGVALIITFGFLWISGGKQLPEAHTYGGKMSIAGYIHAFYFVEAISAIILFLFFSRVSQKEAIVISAILVIHVLYGNHVFLGLYGPEWFPKKPQRDPIVWGTVAVTFLALAARCITIH
jgi:hypothetical protein